MQIINKNFGDFRIAFNNNRPSGITTKLFLKKDDIDVPIFGGAVLADSKFYVITSSQEYIEVLDTYTLYVDTITV